MNKSEDIYDLATLSLANNLYLFDAIEANKNSEAKEIIEASIKRDLYEIISTLKYVDTGDSIFPCALVKKIRLLKQDSLIHFHENNKIDSQIVEYMKENCPGVSNAGNMALEDAEQK